MRKLAKQSQDKVPTLVAIAGAAGWVFANDENQRKPTKIYENRRKATNTYEIR